MPIKIPSELPARKILEKEGVPIIKDNEAARQDIRPLKIAILKKEREQASGKFFSIYTYAIIGLT